MSDLVYELDVVFGATCQWILDVRQLNLFFCFFDRRNWEKKHFLVEAMHRKVKVKGE